MHILLNCKKVILGGLLLLGLAIFWQGTSKDADSQALLRGTPQKQARAHQLSHTVIEPGAQTREPARSVQSEVTQLEEERYEARNDITPLLRSLEGKGEKEENLPSLQEPNRDRGNGIGVFISFRTEKELPQKASLLFGEEEGSTANLTIGYSDQGTLQVYLKGQVIAQSAELKIEADKTFSLAIAHNQHDQAILIYDPASGEMSSHPLRLADYEVERLHFPEAQAYVSPFLAQSYELRVYSRPISEQQLREESAEMLVEFAEKSTTSSRAFSTSTDQVLSQAAPPLFNTLGTKLSLFALQVNMLKSLESLVTLPIEVLGREGITKQANITLTSAQANQGKFLWLQVNNLVYQNKGSVRVNGGPWTDLIHNKVVMNPQEAARGGMVQGGFNTIRLRFPVNNFRAGSNAVVFRFNESDGISIGYRVIRLRVLNAQLRNILPDSQFVNENPNTWKAPFNGSGAVAAGKVLWNRRGSLWNHYKANGVEGFWHGYALPTRRRMTASCADCHTQDGRDLEMFSYSNLSIVERSKFHGLSEFQGKQIASYIRSLSGQDGTVTRAGRPWNPPYQPGPKVGNSPIYNWAAGAGLDAVLSKDSDMVPYLFKTQPGQNPTQTQVNNFFKTNGGYDASVIPISLQLPDWKHWLPMIHPLDAFNGGIWNGGVKNNNGSIGSHPARAIREFRNFLQAMPKGNAQRISYLKQNQNLNNFKQLTNRVFMNFRTWWSVGSSNPNHWRSTTGTATRNLKGNVPREWASTSLARLQSVKQFEHYNEFELQDKHSLNATEQQLRNGYVPKRHWLTGRSYHVYPTGPHFTAAGQKGQTYRGKLIPSNSTRYLGQPLETGTFESTSWYEIQAILTSGHLTGDVAGPIHYNYQMPLIQQASGYSKQFEGMRYVHTANRMYQSMLPGRQSGRVNGWKGSTAPQDQSRKAEGFEMRTMAPYYLFNLNNQLLQSADAQYPNLSAKIAQAHLNQFLDEMERKNSFGQPLYNLNTWPRMSMNYQQPPAQAKNPMLDSKDKRVHDPTPDFHSRADRFYIALNLAKQTSISSGVLLRLKNWCKRAWPRMDWDAIDLSNRGQFMSRTAPSVVQLDRTAYAQVTFKNTGSIDWVSGRGIGVGHYSKTTMPLQNQGSGLTPLAGTKVKAAWNAHRGYSDSHFFSLPASPNGYRFVLALGNFNNDRNFNRPRSVNIYRNGSLLGNLTGGNPGLGKWSRWAYRFSSNAPAANYEIRVTMNENISGNMAFDDFFVQNGSNAVVYREQVENDGKWVSSGDPRWELQRGYLPAGTRIRPNQNYTFQVPLKGKRLGQFNGTQFRLVGSSNGWFGTEGLPVNIAVRGVVALPAVAARLTPQLVGSDVHTIRVDITENSSTHSVEWKVNGTKVYRNARYLPSYYFNSGDAVQALVRSSNPNLGPAVINYRVNRSAKANAGALPSIGATIALRGNNGKYVGVGPGLSPMFCNRIAGGSWERFFIENAGAGRVYLRDYRGYYVSVLGNRVLEATSPRAADAELFYLIAHGQGVSLQSRAGFYVSSQNGSSAMVCNRTAIGAWESFRWEAKPRVMPAVIANASLPGNGALIALAANTGRYLSSMDGRQPAAFTASAVGPWENFRLYFVGGGRYALQASNGKYLVRGSSDQLFATGNEFNPAEHFALAENGGRLSLQGRNNRYLSSENSTGPCKVNRSSAFGWEQFTWTVLN